MEDIVSLKEFESEVYITESGATFSERIGFQFLVKSDHHSKIYIGRWNDFEKFGGSL